jgi:radical SAM superfamily enzyme
MQDAKKIAKLDIQGIKFHVLHILKDTAIERAYRNGKIKLLTKDEYVKVICDFLEQIPSRIVILRLVSSALAKYLVAPLWINEKMQIKNAIIALLAQRKTYQGFYLT